MRRQDWISSSMRSRIKKVKQAYDDLAAEYGREPDVREVAEKLDLSETQVKESLDSEYMYSIIHFESAIASNASEQPVKVIDTIRDHNAETSPEQSLEKKETLSMLTEALQQLPETERVVIDLYYRKEMLLKEIAKILNVSESRVSQIHSKALKRMEAKLSV
jgi:RNA polymerase sigma factor for flagellar operon FliA